MALDPQAVFRFAEKATFRSVGDSAIILMTDTGEMYSCNSTAEAFFRMTDGKRNVAETADAVCEEFDVTPDVLLADIAELTDYLQSEGVLVRLDVSD